MNCNMEHFMYFYELQNRLSTIAPHIHTLGTENRFCMLNLLLCMYDIHWSGRTLQLRIYLECNKCTCTQSEILSYILEHVMNTGITVYNLCWFQFRTQLTGNSSEVLWLRVCSMSRVSWVVTSSRGSIPYLSKNKHQVKINQKCVM